MTKRFYVDSLNGKYDPECDLDALEDMLTNFNEYMAGGFGDDYPERWKPVFEKLESLGEDEIVPASLVELWKQPEV